jgi:hypothetical protein
MARGQQRGCIRLRGAALGIDEENNSLFTIAVDGKIFHLQVYYIYSKKYIYIISQHLKGKSQTERDIWVRALERVIHEKCGYYKPPQEDPMIDLAKRVSTAENQSQMLLEQVYCISMEKWKKQKAIKF